MERDCSSAACPRFQQRPVVLEGRNPVCDCRELRCVASSQRSCDAWTSTDIYGDALRHKLRSFLDNKETELKLKLELAAMLDIRALVRTTYELEGDRLELLLVYNHVEELRAFGRSLVDNLGARLLPNLDAALGSTVKLGIGSKVSKFFEGFGFCEGRIIATDRHL